MRSKEYFFLFLGSLLSSFCPKNHLQMLPKHNLNKQFDCMKIQLKYLKKNGKSGKQQPRQLLDPVGSGSFKDHEARAFSIPLSLCEKKGRKEKKSSHLILYSWQPYSQIPLPGMLYCIKLLRVGWKLAKQKSQLYYDAPALLMIPWPLVMPKVTLFHFNFLF